MIAIIDSSVAVKWYAAEPQSDTAAALIGQAVAAPDLIRAEVGNALWKKVVKGEIERAQALEALPHLAASVTLLPAEPLAGRALEMALDLGHPIHDCFFLLLAQAVRRPLITSDRRLTQRVRGTAMEEHVVLLGDWIGVGHG